MNCLCYINNLSVYMQQWGRPRVRAACGAVQQPWGGRFLPRSSRTQENELPGWISGMFLREKDPCSVWVCSSLWIHVLRRERGSRDSVAASVSSPGQNVRLTVVLETRPEGEYLKTSNSSSLRSLWRGPKFNLLAHTTLRIEHVQEAFKTHDLSLAVAGELQSCLLLSSSYRPSHWISSYSSQRTVHSGCLSMAACAAGWWPSLCALLSQSWVDDSRSRWSHGQMLSSLIPYCVWILHCSMNVLDQSVAKCKCLITTPTHSGWRGA